ncbi:MAG: hypothetical protein QXP58_07695 [Thermoprotei archaeon]
MSASQVYDDFTSRLPCGYTLTEREKAAAYNFTRALAMALRIPMSMITPNIICDYVVNFLRSAERARALRNMRLGDYDYMVDLTRQFLSELNEKYQFVNAHDIIKMSYIIPFIFLE